MLGIDAIRKIVTDRCEIGYSLVDDKCWFPLISSSDIEDAGGGVFVARFRLPIEKEHALARVAHLVCGDVGSGFHLFVKELEEYGIPYLDCVWAIVPDEETEEEGKGE